MDKQKQRSIAEHSKDDLRDDGGVLKVLYKRLLTFTPGNS